MLEVTQGLPYLNMGALYSPFRLRRAELKYLERGGVCDLGDNFWNKGRTQDIGDRYIHLDNHLLEGESK